MRTTASDRSREQYDALRAAGLRRIQIWVPATTRSGFAEECRRQSALVAAADAEDHDLMDFMEAALGDVERRTE